LACARLNHIFSDMKNSIKLVLALVGVAVMALSSCNTVAGFGRDIQGAGEAINKSADR